MTTYPVPRLKRVVPVMALAMLASLSLSRAGQPPIENLKTGDSIGKYEITSEKGVKVPIDSIKGKYKVIFYFSAFEKDTAGRLKAIRAIMEIFDSPDIGYATVWENQIPTQQKASGNNYSIQSETLPAEPKPSWCYLADENGKVILNGFYSYGDVVEKLNTLFDIKQTRDKTIANLVGRASTECKSDPGKENIFFFYMLGCTRCDSEAKLVQANLKALQGRYNVFAVRPEEGNADQSRTDAFKGSTIIDYSGVCMKAMQQPRDPFFIIADQQNHVKRALESVNEVIQYADAGPAR